ncbi:MAG: RnfABCDGE type electron transport complex subunit B [Clostridiaceae bacterium]|nr:RnfABCDGE type electron transport complex subunit B [Clostridiaceae bacterium]
MNTITFALSITKNILVPTLIMLGISSVLGVLILVVSHFFSITHNEKREALLDALPGANCGGCGFAGCDAYASYLLKPGSDTSLCSVGGLACATEIASILGTEVKSREPKVAVVHCQGTRDQTQPRFEYLGTQSCHAAHGLLGGFGSCTYGCLGFGDCIAACAFGAMHLDNGIVHIDRMECTGCGQCVKVCPKALITLIPTRSTVEVRCRNEWPGAQTRKNCHIGCIGCGKCVRVCPSSAITLKGSLAIINQELCIHCDACVNSCPTNAIAYLPLGPRPEKT